MFKILREKVPPTSPRENIFGAKPDRHPLSFLGQHLPWLISPQAKNIKKGGKTMEIYVRQIVSISNYSTTDRQPLD